MSNNQNFTASVPQETPNHLRHDLIRVSILLASLFAALVAIRIIDQQTSFLKNLVHQLWG